MNNILPPNGNEFWSKPARDMAQILITFGGYNRKELISLLIKRFTLKSKRVQERHILQIAQEMRNGIV